MFRVFKHSALIAASLFVSPKLFADPAIPCLPENVGRVLTEAIGTPWNKGSVKAWEESGEMWAMPFSGNFSLIEKTLRTKLDALCNVHVASEGAFSARVLSKASLPIAKAEKSILSTNGTTLGVFSPGKGEFILLMYPARMAAAIARGKGEAKLLKRESIKAQFEANLDLQYVFGDIKINIFGGEAKTSMRNAADAVFKDLRRDGYTPMANSEKSVQRIDGLVPPDEHESYWMRPSSIVRVELTKEKRGKIRLNLHETKQ